MPRLATSTLPDYGQAFEQCTLYGIEFTLIMFEFILFLVLDISTHCFALSAVITYFISTVSCLLFDMELTPELFRA